MNRTRAPDHRRPPRYWIAQRAARMYSLLKRGFVPAIFAVGLLVTSPPARSQEEATAPTDNGPRLLTLEQLHNGQYHLPLLGDEDTPIRFRGGRGSIRYGAGATEQVQAGLVRDQVADAAAVVFIDPGGSGTFIHLLALLDREGKPVQGASTPTSSRFC